MLWPAVRARVALALLSFGLLSCGAMLRQSGEKTAEGVVEGSVDQMDSPETQRAIADVLSSPGIEESIQSLSAAAASGVLEGMSDPEVAAHLQRSVEGLVSHLSATLTRDLGRELQPAITQTVARSVELSLKQALGPEARAGAEAMAAAVARGAMRGLDEGMVESESLAGLTRNLARDATLGFQDAVRISAQRREATGEDGGNVLAALSETADATLTFMPWLIAALAVLAVAVAVWLVFRARRSRRRRLDSEQATAAALASALQALESGERASEVRARMERRVGDNAPDAALMKRVLRGWNDGDASQRARHRQA